MQDSHLIIGLTFLLLIIYGNKILNYLCENRLDYSIPIKEDYPIEYPIEPMFDNYQSIIDEIENAWTIREINSVYVRVILFESIYEGSAPFTSELIEAYKMKEEFILS